MSTDLSSLYGSLYGPMYFATVMSTAFYGIMCMQTFFFYVHYRNDPLRVKIFVGMMWVLNTAHEALTISGVYQNIMAGLLNPLAFESGNPELVLLYLFTTLVSIPTQGFFVYRIYLFSEKNFVAPLVYLFLALVQLGCAAAYVAKTLHTGNGLELHVVSTLNSHSALILATICFSVAAGIDILIAIFMTFLIVRKQSEAGFSSSAHVLQRLAVFAVNTGIWTAMFALLSLVFLHLYPTTLIYVAFGIPLCPIYCNTLLANLNARAYVRGERATYNVDMDVFGTSPGPRASVSTAKGDRRHAVVSASQVPQGIWKTTEVSTFRDSVPSGEA